MRRPGWLRLPRLPRRAAAREAPVPRRRAAVAAALVTSLVAVAAGWVSYTHITALGLRTHQGPVASHMLAIPVDGLIVAGSVILAAGSSLGWLGIALGVAATLFANLQFGLPYGALSAAVSTWPAIAFTVACFMLERWLRARRQEQPDALRAPVPGTAESAAAESLRATLAAGNPWSGRQLEQRFGLTRAEATRVRELVLAGANGQIPHDTGALSATGGN